MILSPFDQFDFSTKEHKVCTFKWALSKIAISDLYLVFSCTVTYVHQIVFCLNQFMDSSARPEEFIEQGKTHKLVHAASFKYIFTLHHDNESKPNLASYQTDFSTDITAWY